jgi:hypothetical protein
LEERIQVFIQAWQTLVLFASVGFIGHAKMVAEPTPQAFDSTTSITSAT